MEPLRGCYRLAALSLIAFTLAAIRKELRGDFRSFPASYFWNAWLEKK